MKNVINLWIGFIPTKKYQIVNRKYYNRKKYFYSLKDIVYYANYLLKLAEYLFFLFFINVNLKDIHTSWNVLNWIEYVSDPTPCFI